VDRIVAMVRDPEHIFIYWDINSEVRVSGVPLLVRVTCVSDGQSWEMRPDGDTDNWYFQVASNRTYRFGLFAVRAQGLSFLAASDEVTTPVRCAEESRREVPEELVEAEKHPLTKGPPKPGRGPAVPVGRATVSRAAGALSAPPKVVPAPRGGAYPALSSPGR
jgi:hypothetical protein